MLQVVRQSFISDSSDSPEISGSQMIRQVLILDSLDLQIVRHFRLLSHQEQSGTDSKIHIYEIHTPIIK